MVADLCLVREGPRGPSRSPGCSPDEATALGRAIRDWHCQADRSFPDYASLHPGYRSPRLAIARGSRYRLAMPSPTSHTYISQRLRLHYFDWGNTDAPPLVLGHGGRDHARSWDWVAERLRDRWHIIAPDLRGHGDSQWSQDGGYAMPGLIYDLAQLIHQRQLAPVSLIGHSLGGNIATRYAGIYPDK